jgi:hypothetical protein
MKLAGKSKVVYLIWAVLTVEIIVSLVTGYFVIAVIAFMTLLLSLAPEYLADRYHIRLPVHFFAGVVMFLFGALYLGEVLDFYERYWWWDAFLHGFSALGLGLVGFIFVFILFEGDRYAAPPWALAFLAFCISISIGVIWEVFEFGMDQIFGMNMQKSGLFDTMGDFMINIVGATIGALAGFVYLKGRNHIGLSGIIDEFVTKNRRLFRRKKP